MGYTIECVSEGQDRDRRTAVMSMIFDDKETALANACAFLRAGFAVSKVSGPNFEMCQTELAAYAQGQRNRRKRRRFGGANLYFLLRAAGYDFVKI